MQRFHQKNLIWLASAVVIYLLLQVLVQVGVINFYYEIYFVETVNQISFRFTVFLLGIVNIKN